MSRTAVVAILMQLSSGGADSKLTWINHPAFKGIFQAKNGLPDELCYFTLTASTMR
jgi:hypothetical protein